MSASQALGIYKPKTEQLGRTIDYEKDYHGGGTVIRLEGTSEYIAWVAKKYYNDTTFEKLWNYSTTNQTARCVNQNNATDWQFLFNKSFKKYEIQTQCWDPSVFWRSDIPMDKAFEQDLNHSMKPVRDCKKEEFSCDNGEQCIFSLHVWDGILDCSDKSDEGPNEDLVFLMKNSVMTLSVQM